MLYFHFCNNFIAIKLSLILQVLCLVFALVSVWLPGSPFDLNYSKHHEATRTMCYQKQNGYLNATTPQEHHVNLPQPTVGNYTLTDRIRRSVMGPTDSLTEYGLAQWFLRGNQFLSDGASRQRRSLHGFDDLDSGLDFNEFNFKNCVKNNLHEEPESYLSAIFFITGIVVCRIGKSDVLTYMIIMCIYFASFPFKVLPTVNTFSAFLERFKNICFSLFL